LVARYTALPTPRVLLVATDETAGAKSHIRYGAADPRRQREEDGWGARLMGGAGHHGGVRPTGWGGALNGAPPGEARRALREYKPSHERSRGGMFTESQSPGGPFSWPFAPGKSLGGGGKPSRWGKKLAVSPWPFEAGRRRRGLEDWLLNSDPREPIHSSVHRHGGLLFLCVSRVGARGCTRTEDGL
jgi:hypothetical protein